MGYEQINAVAPCRTTITNYTALVDYESGISIDNDLAISKTNTRFSAENTLITAINYGVAVAFEHIVLCPTIVRIVI